MQPTHAAQLVNQANRLYARLLLLERLLACPPSFGLILPSTFHPALGSPHTPFEWTQTASFPPRHSASTRARTTDSPCVPGGDPGAHGIAGRPVFVPQ